MASAFGGADLPSSELGDVCGWNIAYGDVHNSTSTLSIESYEVGMTIRQAVSLQSYPMSGTRNGEAKASKPKKLI